MPSEYVKLSDRDELFSSIARQTADSACNRRHFTFEHNKILEVDKNIKNSCLNRAISRLTQGHMMSHFRKLLLSNVTCFVT